MKKTLALVLVIAILVLSQSVSAGGPSLQEYTKARVNNTINQIDIFNQTLNLIYGFSDTKGDNTRSLAMIVVNNTMTAQYSSERTAIMLRGAQNNASARGNIRDGLKMYAENASLLAGRDSSGKYTKGQSNLTSEQNKYLADNNDAKAQEMGTAATGFIKNLMPMWLDIQIGIHDLLGIKGTG